VPAAAAAAEQQLLAAVSMPARSYSSPVADEAVLAVFDASARLKAVTVCRLLGVRRSRQRVIDTQLRRLCSPPHSRLVEIAAPEFAAHRRPCYALAAAPLSLTPAKQTPTTPAPDSHIACTRAEAEAEAGSSCPMSTTSEPGCALAALPVHDDANKVNGDTGVKQSEPQSTSALCVPLSPLSPYGRASPDPPSVYRPGRPPCGVCHSEDATVVFLPCRHQLSCVACWDQGKHRQRIVYNRRERLRRELAEAAAQRMAFQPQCLWCQQPVQTEVHPFTS
jgi:hypothetical protein